MSPARHRWGPLLTLLLPTDVDVRKGRHGRLGSGAVRLYEVMKHTGAFRGPVRKRHGDDDDDKLQQRARMPRHQATEHFGERPRSQKQGEEAAAARPPHAPSQAAAASTARPAAALCRDTVAMGSSPGGFSPVSRAANPIQRGPRGRPSAGARGGRRGRHPAPPVPSALPPAAVPT